MYVVYIGGHSFTSNYLSIERLSANRSKVMFNISIVSFIKGKGPKNLKVWSLTKRGEGMVGQNYTPYCKVYSYWKYILQEIQGAPGPLEAFGPLLSTRRCLSNILNLDLA